MNTIIQKTMLTFAASFAACVASAEETWSAVWTDGTSTAKETWNTAEHWQDGIVGGLNATDTINFANPFAPLSSGSFSGQGIDMVSMEPTFHSLTGITYQTITRTNDKSGMLTVVDPSGFAGVWAQCGLARSRYIANPGEGDTAEFGRVANVHYPHFEVTAGGKARIRDLLGQGNLGFSGAGELVLNSPRSLATRAFVYEAGTFTVESPDYSKAAPAPGATWRFDAAAPGTLKGFTSQEDGRTYVTNWFDADGGEAVAYASLDTCRPFLSSEMVNGHHLVDFGGYKGGDSNYSPSGAETTYGPAAFFVIGKKDNLSTDASQGSDVHEMFVVMKGHALLDGSPFVSPIGRHGGTYQIPMTFATDRMFHPTYSMTGWNARGVGDYRAWLDGIPYVVYNMKANALTSIVEWDPTQLHVIAVNFRGGRYPTLTTLGTTRYTDGKECGGMMIAEAIIYKTELTDAERRQTIDYLKRKWLSGTESKPFDLDAAVIGNASAKINVEDGNTAKIRTLRLGQNIASSANVVKTGGGTLEVEEIVPQSATLEVQGGGVMLSHDTPIATTSKANVPLDGMVCWLDATSDASKFESDANGITKWIDCRDGVSDVFATGINAQGTAMPTKEDDSASGLPVIDFGASVDTSHPYAKITVNGSDMAGVKETFIVWKRKGSTIAGMLCAYGRHGGLRSTRSNTLMYLSQNYANAAGRRWTVDGRPIDPASTTIEDFKNVGVNQFVVINSTAPVAVDFRYLAMSGANNSDTSTYGGGGCAIGEVITYDRQLTDAERRNVTAYLMNKWENGATLGLDTDDTVAKIAFTGGTAPKVGTRTDRTVTAIEGSGTLTKTGAGKLTVTSLDAGITALDIAEGEFSCASLAGLTAISYALDAEGNIGSVSLDGAVTLPAAMTVDVAVDPAFRECGDYPLVKVGSFASTPDISGWTLNVTGASDKLVFSLVRKADGIYLLSAKRGFMMIFR